MNIPLKYCVGNLLENLPTSEIVVVPHVCNNQYTMNTGFNKQISVKWPHIEESFKAEKLQMGEVSTIYATDNVVIAHMVCQYVGVPEGKAIRLQYAELVKCMRRVGTLAKQHGAVVHCRKFGIGLAQGNWAFIETLIKQVWCSEGVDVTVWRKGL